MTATAHDRQRPDVDATMAGRLLRADLGFHPEGLEVIAAGEWSVAVVFTTGAERLVARFAHQREDFDRDRFVEGLAVPALKVPAMRASQPVGRLWVSVNEWVAGDGFDERPAVELRATLPAIFEMLDELQRVEPPGHGWGPIDGEGVAAFSSWDTFLASTGSVASERRTPGLRAAVDAAPGARTVFEAGLDELRKGGGYTGPARLVHGDLLAGNVLVADHAVTAVLDWGCAMRGDPLFDAAMLAFWEPWHPEELGLDAAVRDRLGHLPGFEQRYRACRLKVGLDALGYCAYSGRADEVENCAIQIRQLLTQP